jgi:hypothetical protein
MTPVSCTRTPALAALSGESHPAICRLTPAAATSCCTLSQQPVQHVLQARRRATSLQLPPALGTLTAGVTAVVACAVTAGAVGFAATAGTVRVSVTAAAAIAATVTIAAGNTIAAAATAAAAGVSTFCAMLAPLLTATANRLCAITVACRRAAVQLPPAPVALAAGVTAVVTWAVTCRTITASSPVAAVSVSIAAAAATAATACIAAGAASTAAAGATSATACRGLAPLLTTTSHTCTSTAARAIIMLVLGVNPKCLVHGAV